MALTESTMLPLGTTAPDFALPEPLTGATVRRGDVRGEHGLLVMFICNHCPYVKHVRGQLVAVSHELLERGIGVAAISANDASNYPEDAPEQMAAEARRFDYPFRYLYDESQAVARAYQAACTPDFFLFDDDLALHYRGRLDGATPGNDRPNDGADLRAAVKAMLAGRPAPEPQLPSMGCNIKWKA